MAYDEELAGRIRLALSAATDVSEQRMFGGLGFMVGGNMAVAANSAGTMMVRVAPGDRGDALADQHAEPMVMRGRAMNGWLQVASESLDDDALDRWVAIGIRGAQAAPAKRR